MRLDRGLGRILPEIGLRGCRRLIAGGGVLLNGRAARAATRLREGDRLLIGREGGERESPPTECPFLLDSQGEYRFFFKPAGLHSADLAGGAAQSLERLCSGLTGTDGGRFLQRLDQGTSGIVAFASHDEAARRFRLAERAGQCEKRYVALLCGELRKPVTACFRLDAAGRRKVRVLSDEAPELRWTFFSPLYFFAPDEAMSLIADMASCFAPDEAASTGLTLSAAAIRLGVRHQIRAHAAALGHPLWGDDMYGAASPPAHFFLHHGALAWPEASCRMLPSWRLPERALDAVSEWLRFPAQDAARQVLRRGEKGFERPA